MSEAWVRSGRDRLTCTARDVEESAVDTGRRGRLLEVTLRTAEALAWNPDAPDRGIRGPGVVQYREDHRGRWVVRLHSIGRCLGTVRSGNNEDTQCSVSGLPGGTTRCADHHALGTVGA